MRHEFEEDQEKFRLQPTDELDEASIDGNVNELRLEKISQRVTLISIIIPVLIIIVLAFTYLDIKKRMSFTEDTGMMEFEKLSADLESRFSSLSVRQAKLEENIIGFSNNYDQALAGLNIKIDKIINSLNSLNKNYSALDRDYLTRTDYKPLHDKINRDIKNAVSDISEVSAEIDQVDAQIAAMTKELETQIAGIGNIITKNDKELDKIQGSIKALDAKQIDQPDIDLKVKLATLKIKQDIVSRIDQLEMKLLSLSEKVEILSDKPSAPIQNPPTGNGDKPPHQKPQEAGGTGLIEEQIIQP